MEIKELINRYVAEVGHHLPDKNRADIEQEIRSMLEDALEDRAEKEGREPDEEMVVALLQANGAPQRLAASYLPPQYLVGPRLYPHFLNAFKILFLVLTIVILVTTSISLIRTDLEPTDYGLAILRAFSNFINGGLIGFGILAIAFWVIQRSLPEARQTAILKEWEDWDPRKLEPVSELQQFKIGSLIAEIIINLIAIIIFNVYIDHVGLYTFYNGNWQFIPVLAPIFYTYLPWMTLLWALSIVQCVLVLRHGGWQPVTRRFAIGLDVGTALLALLMLIGAPLITLSPEVSTLFQSLDLNDFTRGQAETGLAILPRMILAIILVVTIIELIQPLYNKFIRGVFLSAPKA